MDTHSTMQEGKALRRVPLVALSLLVAGVTLAACSSTPTSAGNESTSAGVAPAHLSESGCGALPGALPNDPDGTLDGLPDEIKTGYEGLGDDLSASPWSSIEANKGPWNIGISMLPDDNSINHAYLTQMKERFDEAKKAGLVEGELVVAAMTEYNPAQQLQAYQSLVDADVDGIILQAMSGPTMAELVDTAGAEGIVTASFGGVPSAYTVTSQASFYQDSGTAAAATLGQLPDHAGNVLIVNGIEGIDPQVKGRAGVDAALGECQDVTVVGEVSAAFTDPTAKQAVQTFLASHPGQIDAVLQLGGMATGTINAFQQVGREVPLVTMNGASAGALSYWLTNKDSYSPAGTAGAPPQQADAVWDALIRTLAGGAPKSDVIALPSVLVTSDNVGELVDTGTDESSDASPKASIPYVTDENFDQYFERPESNPLP